ncbi:MAG: GNAT family N-acetyltransferase [Hyphomonadaceae bacterium]|nr:GNAT family N-acetyltransferase [Hyphomonadaceae bacterium]
MTPVLETERLRLRGHTLADFEPCAAMWADEGVVRFISGKPSSREESWGRILRYPGMWALLGFGFWAFEEKETGRFVGEGGFGDFQRDITPPITAPEQGWALAPWAHAKGYATEAMRAATAWGETHFGRRDFMCIISPENTPSIRVAEKLGYREIARTTYKDAPTLMFQRNP